MLNESEITGFAVHPSKHWQGTGVLFTASCESLHGNHNRNVWNRYFCNWEVNGVCCPGFFVFARLYSKSVMGNNELKSYFYSLNSCFVTISTLKVFACSIPGCSENVSCCASSERVAVQKEQILYDMMQ